MNLLMKLDSELGYAYFCPNCKSFLCDEVRYCRFCGQSLDWDAEKIPYTGKVKWPSLEDLAHRKNL